MICNLIHFHDLELNATLTIKQNAQFLHKIRNILKNRNKYPGTWDSYVVASFDSDGIYSVCTMVMCQSVYHRISSLLTEEGKEGGSKESHAEIKKRQCGNNLYTVHRYKISD